MKKYFLILAAFCLVSFWECSENPTIGDDPTEQTPGSDKDDDSDDTPDDSNDKTDDSETPDDGDDEGGETPDDGENEGNENEDPDDGEDGDSDNDGEEPENPGNGDNEEPETPEEPADFVETAAELNMKMIWVEGGEFMMGATAEQGSDAYDREYPVRKIKLDSFYIAECEVTQSQWEKIMGTTIEEQNSKSNYPGLYGVGDDFPMYHVNWSDAQAFCEKLSALTGRTYCLPTEAQWEYAARGGKNNDGTKYSGSDNIDDVAWYYGNSDKKTHSVKTKLPNSLGLYDMSGNVMEWCQDWYASQYDEDDTDNPAGPSTGLNRVIRDGSWDDYEQDCRVSCRVAGDPDYRYLWIGFRVAIRP